jgi:Zn-finger nucleic acid-binding protein
MEKVVSQEDPKVVMDVCPTCRGVWLDGGELEAIQKVGILPFLAKFAQWINAE